MKATLQDKTTSSKITVLMYHRIDDTDTDPWDICVSPENFEQQIQFLKKSFNVVSLKDLVENVTTGSLTANSICVTFDDGYADNYLKAKPVLEKYNCTATFFIATTFINQAKPFWWDELELIFLHSKKLPGYLCLQIDGNKYEYTPESELTDKQWNEHKKWKWHAATPTNRCAIFIDIWERLRKLCYESIECQINKIKEWCGYNHRNEYRLPLNEEQLVALSKNNLFTIALHTHTHPDLSSVEKFKQVAEINACKDLLKRMYNIESGCLAYPYGRYNDDTIKAVKELQLSACFTTEATSIHTNSDITKLGRFQVSNCAIGQFKKPFRRMDAMNSQLKYNSL